MDTTTRGSGILLPVFCLPSNYGIGTFGKEAYNFVDFLKKAKQKYWQILPLGVTGFGDSPYQSFSAYAGNPYFIDLDILIEKNLLTKEQCDVVDFGSDEGLIDYEKMYRERCTLLRAAYKKKRHKRTKGYARFVEENHYWLKDYCLFMAVKQRFNNVSWQEWDEDIKFRHPKALKKYSKELEDEIEFQLFLQYLFFKQWFSLKKYANKNNIKIIGDLPIYVAMDSADAWANPELFQFDENLSPKMVAGVPPDSFSKIGQLWGNPLYAWENHKADNYSWWIKRISAVLKMYDTVRIDHFRGFSEYWAVPFGSSDARAGGWCKGPGYDLFLQIKKQLGEVNIIAEDLGVQTGGLKSLLKKSGFPGMKVLQFGFSNMQNSEHLPHNYPKNCIVYTGTHDNTTTFDWFDNLEPFDRLFVIKYCRAMSCNPIYDIIKTALVSVADLVIIPIQDYLELGAEARINTPSTLGNNWVWRLKKGQITDFIQDMIARLATIYFRD